MKQNWVAKSEGRLRIFLFFFSKTNFFKIFLKYIYNKIKKVIKHMNNALQ